MCKKQYFCLLILPALFVCLLSGCGRQKGGGTAVSGISTGEMVPVAEFTGLFADLGAAEWSFAGENALYFTALQSGSLRTGFYRLDCGKNEAVKLAETGENARFSCIFRDGKENFFLLENKSEDLEPVFFMRKLDRTGETLWEGMTDEKARALLAGVYLRGGGADEAGNFCLYDSEGVIYFFDRRGDFQGSLSAGGSGVKGASFPCMVMSGRGNLYYCLYTKTSDTLWQCVYRAVDPDDCSLGEEKLFAPEEGCAIQGIWSGPGDSLILSAGNILWRLEPESGVHTVALALDGEYVNIDGNQLQNVVCREDGTFFLYLYDEIQKMSELAEISYEDRGVLPVKETVLLGMTEDDVSKKLLPFINRFNRKSRRWRVECVEYFSYRTASDGYLDQLSRDLLSGSAPDILDARMFPKEIWEDKGIFLNLEPYFKESGAVEKDDLLASVWRGGCQGKEMSFIMPWFSIDTCGIKRGRLGDRPWNLETFCAFIEDYPDSDILPDTAPQKRFFAMQYALKAWDAALSDYEDAAFVTLLQTIKRIPEGGEPAGSILQQDMARDFLDDRLSVYPAFISSTAKYRMFAEPLGDSVVWAGYPSEDGGRSYFGAFLMLGINSASSHREGAWAFLEYLLSEEAQSWDDEALPFFPVRKDAFYRYVTEPVVKWDRSTGAVTQEEYRRLEELAENAYLEPNTMLDPVYRIVLTESGAYFAGDKSAGETVGIIRNRIALYRAENR